MSLTHRCPGRCDQRVPNRLFACASCWGRLPVAMRRAINVAHRRDAAAHGHAMAQARRWYDEQDASDLIAGTGRHAGHERTQGGDWVACSCDEVTRGRLP